MWVLCARLAHRTFTGLPFLRRPPAAAAAGARSFPRSRLLLFRCGRGRVKYFRRYISRQVRKTPRYVIRWGEIDTDREERGVKKLQTLREKFAGVFQGEGPRQLDSTRAEFKCDFCSLHFRHRQEIDFKPL